MDSTSRHISESEAAELPTFERNPKDTEEQLMYLYDAIHLHPRVNDVVRARELMKRMLRKGGSERYAKRR